MNKTISINLGKLVFHVDEDAYAQLQGYLNSIKTSLQGEAGRDEIMGDIEDRIGELILERIPTERHAVSKEIIYEIIAIMGKPEDYIVEDDSISPPEEKPKKQLFRDSENGYIGGVCAGLAHYLNVEALWVRLVYFILLFVSQGFFFFLYIILVLVIPRARTTAEKLAMRGEPINLGTIEGRFREEFSKAKNALNNKPFEGSRENLKHFIQNLFSVLDDVLRNLIKIVIRILGFLLVSICGLSLISIMIFVITMGAIGLFGVSDIAIDFPPIAELAPQVPAWLSMLLVLLVAGIPLYMLFALGLQLIKNNIKLLQLPVFLSLLAMWFISIGAFGYLSLKNNLKDRKTGEIITVIDYPISTGDTLYIVMNHDLRYSEFPERNTHRNILKFDENDKKFAYGSNIKITLAQSTDKSGKIRVRKTAYASEVHKARKIAGDIDYAITKKGNKLIFPSFYQSSEAHVDRKMMLHILVYLPDGVVLHTDEYVENFITSGDNHYSIQTGWQTLHRNTGDTTQTEI
ncbi:MAG: PspC domain-containing protein [Cryomorphaceae bacterium]|nr:PspC domain-containing protein [Cryomorphaceae bacterium]